MKAQLQMSRFSRTVLVALAGMCSLVMTAVAHRGVNDRSGEDAFFIRDADLLDGRFLHTLEQAPDRDDPLRNRFGFFVHQIVEGHGAVIGFRSFSEGDLATMDDEKYRKLTLWLPGGLPEGSSRYDLRKVNEVVAVWSAGASAWPGNDCSGYISRGELYLSREGSRVHVSLDGWVELGGNSQLFDLCKPIHVEKVFSASELSYEKLTPWLGRRQPSTPYPYAQTYRQPSD